MQRILSNQLKEKIGAEVLVQGWLHSLRMLGAVNFLHVRDRGGITQVVIEDKGELEKVKDLQPGSVLTIEGSVQESAQFETGAEIIEPEISVEVPIIEPLPLDISKKEIHANLDTILDYRPLALRNEKQAAIFKIQATILKGFRRSMSAQGFEEFVSPVLMGVPSESGADVFEAKYFENKAYLAQSPQIYKQIMVGVFERVFTIAKVFRAEKHNTSRHIMELTQLDGEMGFIETFDEVLDVVEIVVRDILELIESERGDEIKSLGIELPKVPEGKFPKVKVKEIFTIVEERTGKGVKREELDLEPDDEREIGKWALEEHGSDFVWVLNFKANKNFYTWDNPEDTEESLSFDLVCRGLEWLSGTHRIHEYELLLERLKKQGLTSENFDHYLQAFKYGMPSEAGFSLGLERMTQQICQLSNIREATLFPSDLKRIAGEKIKREVVKGEENVVAKIREILDKRGVKYEYKEHEPTPTSEDSAKVRGTSIEEGVKALILKGQQDGENIMVCLPGHKKIDMKKLALLTGQRYSFEDPKVIKDKWGLIIGGVPPFGNILGLETFFDDDVLEQERAAFNCGTQTQSITMKSQDLVDTADGLVVDLT
ncbi:aspartate--tRNA(Asn) ligase [Candidatus Dojkabacteria bacterium]|nr:aspartate--tRNA(Asn) ligase [Candidatus Dojkabacteria bacterium]